MLADRVARFLEENKSTPLTPGEIYHGLYSHWLKNCISGALYNLSTAVTPDEESWIPFIEVCSNRNTTKYRIPTEYD